MRKQFRLRMGSQQAFLFMGRNLFTPVALLEGAVVFLMGWSGLAGAAILVEWADETVYTGKNAV